MNKPQDDLMPPPRKGDVLIGPGTEYPMANACLNLDGSDYGYRQGYWKAAQLLAQHVCDTCRNQDLLVYPIVYNYRHHIELALKHLIGVGSYLSDRQISPDVQKLLFTSHSLIKLWETLRPILFAAGKAVGWTPANEDIEGVTSYIQQLSAVDDGSYSFRYATNTKGDPSLPTVTHLNIYVFANHMEQLAEYLDTIAFGFSMNEDLKQEYEATMAEIRSYYSDSY